MRRIEAEYQDGVLKPTHPLRLKQGERVSVMVLRSPDAARWDLSRLARTGTTEDKELSTTGLDAWAADLVREDDP